MFVFYDWPFQHMYSAKNVANIVFSFNSWLTFSDNIVSFMGICYIYCRRRKPLTARSYRICVYICQ